MQNESVVNVSGSSASESFTLGTKVNVNYFIFAGPAKQNDKMATLQKRYEYNIDKSKPMPTSL